MTEFNKSPRHGIAVDGDEERQSYTSPGLDKASTEETLIARARDGDFDAFNELILTYQNLAYSIAYRTLQESESAADAVQESLIKAFRSLETFRGGNFRAWLSRIVTNTCYDTLRSWQRKPTESLDDLPVEADYSVQLIDHSESPHQHAERSELNALLESGINKLPDDQRMVVVLCDVHGFSYEEISEMTGVAMGTVKSRLSRARLKLRDILQQQPELLPATFRPNDTS